jgi:prolyl 4-hydroxylase
MSKKKLDANWGNWLQENISRNCNPEKLLDILLKNHFSVDSIKHAMGEHFPENSVLLAALPDNDIDYKSIAEPYITRSNTGMHVLKVPTDKLQLYVIEDFLSHEECDKIISIATESLRPSTVTTGEKYKSYRTSSTSDLSLLNNSFVGKIDEKISRALGIRHGFSEGIQAQKYEVGQEFKQHTDYFEPGTAEYDKYAGPRGNRTWTFMVYLNTVPKGGGTKFFAIDKIFSPTAGTAVIWNNLNIDGTVNAHTLHAGLPVEDGYKFIITKWFRELGKGPMFFDVPSN